MSPFRNPDLSDPSPSGTSRSRLPFRSSCFPRTAHELQIRESTAVREQSLTRAEHEWMDQERILRCSRYAGDATPPIVRCHLLSSCACGCSPVVSSL